MGSGGERAGGDCSLRKPSLLTRFPPNESAPQRANQGVRSPHATRHRLHPSGASPKGSSFRSLEMGFRLTHEEGPLFQGREAKGAPLPVPPRLSPAEPHSVHSREHLHRMPWSMLIPHTHGNIGVFQGAALSQGQAIPSKLCSHVMVLSVPRVKARGPVFALGAARRFVSFSFIRDS